MNEGTQHTVEVSSDVYNHVNQNAKGTRAAEKALAADKPTQGTKSNGQGQPAQKAE